MIIFLVAAGLAHVVLRYTRYGRQVYAVGGNPEAARLSGLNVNRVTASVYVIMGFFAGLGSFVLSARLNSAEAVAGTGYELTVIASVVIGGTSLFGGSGTIFGTVIGSILIGVLLNGLVLINVSSYIQQIVIGVIIVLAVAFDTFAKSRRRRDERAQHLGDGAVVPIVLQQQGAAHFLQGIDLLIRQRPARGDAVKLAPAYGLVDGVEVDRQEERVLRGRLECARVSGSGALWEDSRSCLTSRSRTRSAVPNVARSIDESTAASAMSIKPGVA